jgi:hypothetical protein
MWPWVDLTSSVVLLPLSLHRLRHRRQPLGPLLLPTPPLSARLDALRFDVGELSQQQRLLALHTEMRRGERERASGAAAAELRVVGGRGRQ